VRPPACEAAGNPAGSSLDAAVGTFSSVEMRGTRSQAASRTAGCKTTLPPLRVPSKDQDQEHRARSVSALHRRQWPGRECGEESRSSSKHSAPAPLFPSMLTWAGRRADRRGRRGALVGGSDRRRAAGDRLLLFGVWRGRVRRRLSRGPASAFGDHIRAGWITHSTRHPCGALCRQFTAEPDQRPLLA